MTLPELVEEILSYDVGEVIASPLSLKLISVYSQLYLNGRQPRWCGECQKKYYYQLKKDGMKKAEHAEKAKNRTCQPAWNGLKFIPQLAKHFNSALITDDEAIKLLNEGHLQESNFVKLPDG